MKKKSMCALLLLVLFLCTGCQARDSIAIRATEVILANTSYFEAPETLRFVSGTGNLKRDPKGYVDGLLYARLEQENAQGVKEIGYYVLYISYDDYNGYVVDPVLYPDYYLNKTYFERQDIPAEEVNEHLAAHWAPEEK